MSHVESPDNMRRWANQVAKRCPQVSEVLLVGDPAMSWTRPFWHQPRCGWDIVIRLAEAAYAEKNGEARQLEQQIAFDPTVCFDGLNLLFLRPEGRPGYWAWPAGKPAIWVQQTPPWMRRPLLAGDTLGDLAAFRKGCAGATVLFSATGEPMPIPIYVGGNGQRREEG
jgi:hypothetical protein